MKRILLALALGSALAAQDLPKHFFVAGVGVAGSAVAGTNPTSGFFTACTHIAEKTFGCFANDVAGSTTSTRAGIERVILAKNGFYVTAKADAGAATGASGGVGGSYGVGGAVIYRLPIKSIPGLHAVFSGQWIQSNVTELVNAPRNIGTLRDFGSRGIYRFGIGRAF